MDDIVHVLMFLRRSRKELILNSVITILFPVLGGSLLFSGLSTYFIDIFMAIRKMRLVFSFLIMYAKSSFIKV